MIDKSHFLVAIGKTINAHLNLKRKFLKVNSVLSDNRRFSCDWNDRLLVFDEDIITTAFDPHSVFHTAWAARILARAKPGLHIDISSDLRFVTLVSAFIPIDFYDYRPVEFTLSGLKSKPGNLMALPFNNNSVSSISCMHVVEHIGLERYGDPLNAQGDIKAMQELERVLKPGVN